MPHRCAWPGHDPLYCAYHDTEWGVPETDSRALWEKLVLDGFQAGLSWITILRRREGFRRAFADFDPEVVGRYGDADVARLLADPGIIRSRSKIEATIGNAQAFLRLRDKGQDFAELIWSSVGGVPINNAWRHKAEVPAETPLSLTISKMLKAQGYKFVGPVIVYAWMQATGQVNDHVVDCFRHEAVKSLWAATPAVAPK